MEEEGVRLVNILVLGSTGVGKSSLCNFLFHEKCDEGFQTSDSKLTCTKDLKFATVNYEDEQVNIIDSPGLNEPDFREDVSNLRRFMRKLKKFGYINLVLLCALEDSRNDNQVVKTYQYYKSIFSDVVTNANVVFISTRCSVERWEEYSDNDYDHLNKKRREFKDEMLKHLKLSPHNVYYTNVKIPPRRREQVYHQFKTKQFADCIFGQTLHARESILKLARNFKPRFIRNMHFELPPTSSLIFKNVITTVKLNIQETINREDDPRKKLRLVKLIEKRDKLRQERNQVYEEMIDMEKDVRFEVDNRERLPMIKNIFLDDFKFSFTLPRNYTHFKRIDCELTNATLDRIETNPFSLEVYVRLKVHFLKQFHSLCYAVIDGKTYNHERWNQQNQRLELLDVRLDHTDSKLAKLASNPVLMKSGKFLKQYEKKVFTLKEFMSILKMFSDHDINENNFQIDFSKI